MVSALDSRVSVQGFSLAQVLTSWARHFTLILPQMFSWTCKLFDLYVITMPSSVMLLAM